ncbi:MAG: hypothetical protein WCD80_00065 [Desulfobaccales bacterium]
MITSNTKYPFGGKVATVETKSFNCMISTAKEGLFKKQSIMFSDLSAGMSSRRHVAKLLFNDLISSAQRIELHDIIVHAIDEAGMSGKSLGDTLTEIFEGLKREGIGFGTMIESL